MTLIIEDALVGEDLASVLKERRFDVRHARNFFNAVDIIEEDIEQKFDTIILDLAMPIRGLPDEAKEDAKKIFPGWAFYKYVLNNKAELQKSTIFLSGFADEFRHRMRDNGLEYIYNSLNVVSKGDPQCITKVINFVRTRGQSFR